MAAEFIARDGILKGLILSLHQGDEWTIGRDPDACLIVIEDPQAARVQLRVRKTADGQYEIENLSDTHPVLLNGAPITGPVLLKDEDQVTLGGTTFHFHPEGASADFGFESPFNFDEPEEEAKQSEAQNEEPTEEEPVEEKEIVEEEIFEETPFEDETAHAPLFDETPAFNIDLSESTRFIIKVIAGPNTGAEFALDQDHSYLVGTDTATCDIIFNDLSVSREHARLQVRDNIVSIEDLGSRNGVIVDKDRITGLRHLSPNSVVSLGTSSFLLIDKEAPSETIATPLYEAPPIEEEEPELVSETVTQEVVEPAAVPVAERKGVIPMGTLVLALIVGSLAVMLGIGLVSLLHTKDIVKESKDYAGDIQAITRNYPGVRYTFNPVNGKLFLLGHVRNGVEHKELLYQLSGLTFLKGVDDNVVNDEAVWQEMNIVLSKRPEFKGVSMHAPEPGVFVVTGYLQNEKQAADLMDYLNVNFNYINLLQNRVVVEESVVEEVRSLLVQNGFAAVTPTLNNGELQLTGYVGLNNIPGFEKVLEDLKTICGIRTVRNFVVAVTPEQGVIDLNKRGGERRMRYLVTGTSKHCNVNVNVVINGRILTRGDCIDGYTITSIQPHTIFLEREGLKYKIEYNTCSSMTEGE